MKQENLQDTVIAFLENKSCIHSVINVNICILN